MKIAITIFDFCDTLIPFQTGDKFLKRVIYEHGSVKDKLATSIITNRLFKKILITLNPNTKIINYLLPKIKGIDKNKIDKTSIDYAKTILIPNINEQMIDILNTHENYGRKIMIVSGGYEEYLKYVFDDRKEITIIGTKLEYSNGYATGKLNGKICLSNEKVNRINNYTDIEIDREESTVYSDCMSDLPMFKLVSKNRFLVKLPKDKNRNIKITNIDGEI